MALLPVRPEPVEGPAANLSRGWRPRSRPHRRLWVLGTLAAIVAISGSLRFQGIADKGIFNVDAANYVREGRLLAGVARSGAGAANRWIEERLTGKDVFRWEAERARIAEEASRGSAPGYAKPTHTLLVALSLLARDDDPSAANLLSALFGTATVLLVFVVARAIFGSATTALVAAIVLGFSAYHVIYSREGIPDAGNGFFFLLATYCYWRNVRERGGRFLVAAGVLAGVVYTANDRWAFMPLLFVIPELWLALRARERWRSVAGRLLVLLVAMAAPAVLWEMLYYILILVSRRYGDAFFPLAQLPPQGWLAHLSSSPQQVYLTYFEQLWFRLDQWTPQGFDLNLAAYPSFLWTLQGPLTLLLVLWPVAHHLVAVVRRSHRPPGLSHFDVFLWCQVLVPIAFFSVIYYHNLRFMTLSLPAIALLAARGWQHWTTTASNLVGTGRATAVLRVAPQITVGALALHALATAAPAIHTRTGLPDALTYVRDAGGFLHLSVNHPMSKVYVGEGSAFPADAELTRARAVVLLDAGYDYLVVSLYEFMGRDLNQPHEPSTPFLAEVLAVCEPAFVTPDSGDLYFYQFAYDGHPTPARGALLLASLTAQDRLNANRVYDLRTCLPRIEARRQA